MPNFEVCEGNEAYFLDGNIPGLVNLVDTTVEFLENQKLIMRLRQA
jgi:hypothetical protein